jgi:uncharacterized surface protein with fasciclin (FAS1) repeats
MSRSKLTTPLVAALAMALAASTTPARAADIVDTAAKAGGFGQLLHAVRMAGLEATLRGKGPMTVFAPSDEAFGKLPKGTLFKLLEPERKAQLVALLKAHVANGDYPAARLEKPKAKEFSIPTAGGQLTIKRANGLMAGAGKVVKADVKADNGTIHVIDQVIVPAAVAAALAKPLPKPAASKPAAKKAAAKPAKKKKG